LNSKASYGELKSKPTLREDKVLQRQSSILRAVLDVISQQGLTGITMGAIAKAAGCSFGVVAFHFKSKEGVILAALDYLAEEYDQQRRQVISPTATPLENLNALIENDFDTHVCTPRSAALWLAFWAESVRVESYRKKCAEIKARYIELDGELISALAKQRSLNLDSTFVAHSLNALIHGLWTSNLVLRNTGVEWQKLSKNSCRDLLRSYFPDDF